MQLYIRYISIFTVGPLNRKEIHKSVKMRTISRLPHQTWSSILANFMYLHKTFKNIYRFLFVVLRGSISFPVYSWLVLKSAHLQYCHETTPAHTPHCFTAFSLLNYCKLCPRGWVSLKLADLTCFFMLYYSHFNSSEPEASLHYLFCYLWPRLSVINEIPSQNIEKHDHLNKQIIVYNWFM